MTNEDRDRFFGHLETERLADVEQRRANTHTHTPLFDWGLAALNTVWMSPYAMTLAMLVGSSPERAAKIAEAKQVASVFLFGGGGGIG